MWFLFVNSQEGYTVTLLCKENDTFHTKLFLYTFCADEKKIQNIMEQNVYLKLNAWFY